MLTHANWRSTSRASLQRWIALVLVAIGLSWAGAAGAADFAEYARLVEEANAAHEALDGASDASLPGLRDTALSADLALIAWLDTFLASGEFEELPAEQQSLAYQDRYRNEYNASRLLIALDRCEEARDRVRRLLDSSVNDPELRPRLTESYDEALTCLNRPRLATIHVDSSPADAEVLVDGEFLGLATTPHEVALGEHDLLVRADGYASQELRFEATTEGERIAVGPVSLILLETDLPSSGPNAVEWTLWGVGVVGLASGVGLWLAGNDRQSQLDNLPPNEVPVDPEGEQQQADNLKLAGYILAGVGLASGITGTVLYFTRRGNERSPTTVSVGPTFIGRAPGVGVTLIY